MTICLRYGSTQQEAEDMMQESFVAIFGNIAKFKNEGAFDGWLRKIVVHSCLRVIRKKRVDVINIDEKSNEFIGIDSYTYSSLGEKDLMKLINELPMGYKLVFNMHIIEGFSHDEIAKLLKIQPASSRSQLVKARKMLQNQIIKLQKIAV